MFESIRVGGRGKPDAVVIGVFSDRKLDAAAKELDTDGSIAAALKRGECTGELGRIAEAFPGKGGAAPRVLIVGLGDRGKLGGEQLRKAAGAVGRRLAQTKDSRVRIDLAAAAAAAKLDGHDAGRCFGEGLGLIAWSYDRLKGSAAKNTKRTRLEVSAAEPAFGAGLGRGIALAISANYTRSLSQTPPNIATTDFIVEQAQELARRTGMSCRVIRGGELGKERLQGLINVGKASEHKPCLIRLEYRPAGVPVTQRPAVLVGKTMIYDCGGLSIKTMPGMAGMKRDKDGGCAVLGAMHAIAATIRPRRRIVALLSVAENSISDEAYRPDDVITFRNGVTVEVTNTDAEGRLVLADALCWACDTENPEFIVDIATLTGGVVVALGSAFAGMFCEDDALRGRIEAAADRTGERVWRLPMHDDYRDMMRSGVADILNSAPIRAAHPIQGAAFLSYFVGKNIPWAHLDIAGVHATESDSGPFIKGPTGFGARLLAELFA